MRRTITISVSDEMFRLVHEGTRRNYYSSVSEYIRFLVRRDTRPATLVEPEIVLAPPRTANQCMEDAWRQEQLEAAMSIDGQGD